MDAVVVSCNVVESRPCCQQELSLTPLELTLSSGSLFAFTVGNVVEEDCAAYPLSLSALFRLV